MPGKADPGTALVTGASSGIGLAVARALAERGHPLVLVARDEGRLLAVAAGFGVPVEVLVADLADRTQLLAVERRLADPDRPVELLVNNAGSGTFGHLADLDPDTLTRELDLGVLAVVRLTRAVLPGLLERGHGGVLNMSSTVSTGVAPRLAAYAASKAFIDSFTRSLAESVAGTGVRVTAVRPGYTRTQFHYRAGQEVGGVPDVYWLEPAQVAQQALAAFDSGTVLVVPRGSRSTRARALTRRYATRALARMRATRARRL